ncbi:hypothetical protein EUX98_g915 [Antrodiella citrinella]|uniref:Uncharacterized protein n=1 Tax=Antrodiella citrinella TaxID=2447956 RepID=A0A4S4N2W5_9APHY|nr:hypothetical protein EUX98_g915 [Antrodiella citrinella]
MSDPSYPAFPILAFLGCVLALLPIPWHLQAWNSGTCLFMFWSAVACLNLGVNSIVWHGNAIDHAPVWCDISSRIIVAVAVALPASSLCINRRLYHISSVQIASISRGEKRRAIMIDLSIGLGIPLFQVLCQYIVSGHRYDIFEDIGCYPYTYNTPPSYPLSQVWPLAIGLVSAVYCVLTLRAFFRRRAAFAQYLASNPSLTTNRYFRLMALASTELMCTIPISSYGLYLNLSAAPMHPWISWADTHFDYWQVNQVPAAVWRQDSNASVAFELSRWAAPFCAFVFFAYFGFAAEARKNYSTLLLPVTSRLRACVPWKSIRHPKGILPLADSSAKYPLPSPPMSSTSKFHLLSSGLSSSKSICSSFDSPALPPYDAHVIAAEPAMPPTPSTLYSSSPPSQSSLPLHHS